MNTLHTIENLIGIIKEDDLKYVDYYVSDHVGVFIPVAGPCLYSITPLHSHPSYSFILNCDNNCAIYMEEEIIHGKSGKICAISPHIAHHEILSDDFSRYIAIFIKAEYFEHELLQYSVHEKLILKGTYYKVPENLRLYIKDFMMEYDSSLPGNERLLEAIGLKITHLLIRELLHISGNKEKISSRIGIDNVIEYININYDKEITVDELSCVIKLSPAHFSRVFKKETGKSPTDFIIDVRLHNAKKMLLAEEKSVTEVAMDCGFNSSSHFSASFQKRYKMSPSEYKKIIIKHNF